MARILVVFLLFSLMSCATSPRPHIDASHKPTAEQQKDAVECSAIASQAASGAGGFWTDVTLRNAAYHQARQQYLAQCLESRGWMWKTRY